MMKTFRLRKEDIRRRWFLIDAEGQTLGKVAVRAAHLLMGKESPTFTPGVDGGEFVIITSVEKVKVSGRKMDRKVYRHHTQYLGGLVEEPMGKLIKRRPQRVVELAVRRMLPKNTLGRHFLRRLKVYGGKTHPHEAQRPEQIQVERATLPPRQPAGPPRTEKRKTATAGTVTSGK
jgi:large subunit ribosomal protein L13